MFDCLPVHLPAGPALFVCLVGYLICLVCLVSLFGLFVFHFVCLSIRSFCFPQCFLFLLRCVSCFACLFVVFVWLPKEGDAADIEWQMSWEISFIEILASWRWVGFLGFLFANSKEELVLSLPLLCLGPRYIFSVLVFASDLEKKPRKPKGPPGPSVPRASGRFRWVLASESGSGPQGILIQCDEGQDSLLLLGLFFCLEVVFVWGVLSLIVFLFLYFFAFCGV